MEDQKDISADTDTDTDTEKNNNSIVIPRIFGVVIPHVDDEQWQHAMTLFNAELSAMRAKKQNH